MAALPVEKRISLVASAKKLKAGYNATGVFMLLSFFPIIYFGWPFLLVAVVGATGRVAIPVELAFPTILVLLGFIGDIFIFMIPLKLLFKKLEQQAKNAFASLPSNSAGSSQGSSPVNVIPLAQLQTGLPRTTNKPHACTRCGGPVINRRCSSCGISWCANCGQWNEASVERCIACQFMLPPPSS